MYPRRSPTTHTEQLGDEASVYDWARAQVHALNPTAARVWRQCDGATSPETIAAVLHTELGIPEADAVVDLTLRQLARVHLLELPLESRGDRPGTTRRWLLGRGLAAAMLPAIYSIMAWVRLVGRPHWFAVFSSSFRLACRSRSGGVPGFMSSESATQVRTSGARNAAASV